MAEEGDKNKKPLTFAGLTALAQALDSKQAHTSFGKLPLSNENTKPIYAFSKAGKQEQSKLYQAELMKTENTGKNSPGPIYEFQDKIKYNEKPNFSFGTSERMGEIKPKYDFYENALFLDDPVSADHTRKKRVNAPKVGTEPRMQPNSLEQNPGPQYWPKDKPEIPVPPKYTLGSKRGDALKTKHSTPGSVGPGRYVPEQSAFPSTKQNFPKWTLPKAGRPNAEPKKFDKNQTYDTRSGIGNQQSSKNRTSSHAHFGSSNRQGRDKLGTFKDQMQGGQSIKLYHPKW